MYDDREFGGAPDDAYEYPMREEVMDRMIQEQMIEDQEQADLML